MNILFISISSLPHISKHSISLDLLHEFKRNGHNIYILCSLERRDERTTFICEEFGCTVLRVKIGNNKRANLIEKGLTQALLPYQYIQAIKKYYSDIKFDLVMYPTPPVTQGKTVEYLKKRDGSITYLVLRDIFPQNALDIGLMRNNGIKGLAYRYFRKKEEDLYKISDYIGCMSEANVDYLLKHNKRIEPDRVGICPNCIEIEDKQIDDSVKENIRRKYGLPLDKKIFIYGGNLGKPQGIPFLIECLEKTRIVEQAFFLIIGAGTEYSLLDRYCKTTYQNRVRLMNRIPKEDYDILVAACDIGLIFLDHRFTIPNFPSRLLGYIQAHVPVFACTDPNTDIGEKIVEGDFGWWCESNDPSGFLKIVQYIAAMDESSLSAKGDNGFKYLQENYDTKIAYNNIMAQISKRQ